MTETKEKTVNFGVGVPASVHKQLVMQALEADMTFADFMREFIQDGLATLPELEIDVKEARKMARKERMAGR